MTCCSGDIAKRYFYGVWKVGVINQGKAGMEKPTLSGRCRRQFRGDSVSDTVDDSGDDSSNDSSNDSGDDSIDDSEGIICLNSRGLARVQCPLVGLARSGNPRLCFPINGIPEESFLILPIFVEYQKRFLRNTRSHTVTGGYRFGSAYRPSFAPTPGYSNK